MDEIQNKLKRLSANWREYELAERWHLESDMDRLNLEHRELCRWLAAHGMPFTSLRYDPLTLTFSAPRDTMQVASQ